MTQRGFVLSASLQAETRGEGRFEYRIWPRAGHPAIALLNAGWPLVAAERRSDIYLVHAGSDRMLVKLRSGDRVEIKRRDADTGRIQHWSMPVSDGFPLTAGVRHDLALALGLRAGLPEVAGLSAAHLLAAIDAQGGRVIPRTVSKARLVFRSGGCRAEICRVTVGGWTGRTVALDAADLPTIARGIDALHLGSLPNRSYGEALMRLLAPDPLLRGLLVHTQFEERSSG